jgi:O-antigen ligase
LLVCIAGGIVALSGPELWERFSSIFVPTEELDPAARSRLELWQDCLDVLLRFPVCGIGPENWPRIAASYGWPPGKEAHSLWLQTGAEFGVPGLLAILCYYLIICYRLYRLPSNSVSMNTVREAVMVGLSGFIIAAQFVSLELLETPYYLALCGLGALRLQSDSTYAREDITCPLHVSAS